MHQDASTMYYSEKSKKHLRFHQNWPRQIVYIDFPRSRISRNAQTPEVFIGFRAARTSDLVDLASQKLYVDFPARNFLRLLTVLGWNVWNSAPAQTFAIARPL